MEQSLPMWALVATGLGLGAICSRSRLRRAAALGRQQCGTADLSILVLSLNAETVDPKSLREALQEVMKSDLEAHPYTPEKYFVLCLQESLQIQQSLWDESMLDYGLVSIGSPECLPATASQASKTVVHVYANSKHHSASLQSSIFKTHTKKEMSNKGGALSLLSWQNRGFHVGLGSFHLDGKLKESKRIAAMEQALGSLPPCTIGLFAGDFNFTIDPLKEEATGVRAVGSCMNQIAAQIKSLKAGDAVDALEQLEPSTLTAFQEILGTPETRCVLQEVADSNPKHVKSANNSGHLELQELSEGSFPTYRICREAISSSSSIRVLRRHQSLSAKQVHQCYFSDDVEKKSGRLKKRKDLVRLQCGWNDRLYAGTVGGDGTDPCGSSMPKTRIWTHDPVLLRRVDGSVADHALVCWSCRFS
jgi:hypothetical protein